MKKIIEKTYDKIVHIQHQRFRPSMKPELIMKELEKLYNIGVGVGKRTKKCKDVRYWDRSL